ncbi:MAG: ABC transporter substrate-binding protein [Promethearchaeota archaeon]
MEIRKVNKTRVTLLLILLTILSTNVPLVTSTPVADPAWATEWRPHGGYIDEIQFKIYIRSDEGTHLAIQALQDGSIDAFQMAIPLEYQEALRANPDINLTSSLTNNLRIVLLNTKRFPTNITGYRRAIAFAIDKEKINNEVMGGAAVPMDSHIPLVATRLAIEDKLDTHFYDKDIAAGNVSLDRAGFKDLNGDGWREYDVNDNNVWDAGVDKSSEECEINLYADIGNTHTIFILEAVAEGLNEMGMKAVVTEMALNSIYYELYDTGNHWGTCWIMGFHWDTPARILYRFRTGNFLGFGNSTIDEALDNMMAATTLEEMKKHTLNASRMLAYEQPVITCYNDATVNGFRNDEFEGFFEFVGEGYTQYNPYIGTKVKLKTSEGGPYGGTFKFGIIPFVPHTFNPFRAFGNTDDYIHNFEWIFRWNVYETLWTFDPNTWDLIPGLAYNWTIEDTTVSGEIQNGKKYTFLLYNNVTWHDGVEFTADDVNHSIYLWKMFYPGLNNIYRTEVPNNYTFIIYTNNSRYLEFVDSTGTSPGLLIVPWHIWKDVENITAFEPENAQIIGTGPFMWNKYVPGEYVSLIRNPYWRWAVREPPSITTSETTTSATTQTSSTSHGSYGLSLPMALVIFVTIDFFRRKYS